MSYKIEKPYSEKEKLNFIVEYNHKQGLRIKETNTAIYALVPWEDISDNDELIDNTEAYKVEETKRIAKLSLTKREVFLAIYKDSGLSPEEIKSSIKDTEALIEFEYANEYYRGNPLIDIIGASLGYTKEDLDYLFINKCFKPSENLEGGEENA